MRNILLSFLLLSLFSFSVQAEDEDIVYENAYLKMTPDLVSNVQGKNKYIRTSVQLMTNRADMLYQIEEHLPLIRHIFLMTLVDKNGEDIKSPEGKEALRKELLDSASKALDELTETKGLLTDLFFTTYYVQ